MPVYRGDDPAYVQEALLSLMNQTLRANEIVLVQDGPIPQVLSAVLEEAKLKMPEINHVVLEENQGLSAALNLGIDAAKNEWLARMDADDICLPYRFEKQFYFIARNPHLHILGSWIDEYNEDMRTRIATRRTPEKHTDILSHARWRCPFNHMTVVYKKSTLIALGKYKNYGAVGDDYELWGRFLMNGYKSANLPEVLVKARTGKDFFSVRRRGLKYFKNELKEINDLYRMGLINPLHYIFHFTTKAIVRLSPVFLVKWIYKGIRKTA